MARILLVDDSKTQSYAAVKILEQHGHQVITARNGAQGVEFARTELPDLIIMDVIMPGLNGYQAARLIAMNQSTRHIPVVMCSSRDEESDLVWGRRQGPRDYILKPIEEEALLKTVDNLLPKMTEHNPLPDNACVHK